MAASGRSCRSRKRPLRSNVLRDCCPGTLAGNWRSRCSRTSCKPLLACPNWPVLSWSRSTLLPRTSPLRAGARVWSEDASRWSHRCGHGRGPSPRRPGLDHADDPRRHSARLPGRSPTSAECSPGSTGIHHRSRARPTRIERDHVLAGRSGAVAVRRGQLFSPSCGGAGLRSGAHDASICRALRSTSTSRRTWSSS